MKLRSAFARACTVGAFVSLGALTVSGCGGAPATGAKAPPASGSGSAATSSAAQPASGGSASGKPLSLTIGVGSAATNYGPFWLAQADHLFAKNGLRLHVMSYATSSTTANVVSGGLDQLQLFTAPLGLELAEHGKPITIVFELASFNAHAMVVIGAKSVTSASQLRSEKNCRIGTIARGTVPYAFAVRYVKAERLTNCHIIQESTPAPLMAAVSSGSVQAGIVTYSNALAALAKHGVTMLLNPLDVPAPLAKRLVPQSYPAFVVFGLRSTVRSHGPAVVRFVRALRQADALLVKTSAAKLGSETAPLKAFVGVPPSLLAKAWKGTLSQIPTGPQAGFISPAGWKTALNGFSDWGLPGYSVSNPKLAYKQVIDMSYFDKAG